MSNKETIPGLFGQKHSSRDYTKAECWGKNQFNSSFPASLVAYVYSKDVKPVYIKTDRENNILHQTIESKELLGIDPLNDDAYYNYEAGFTPYEKFYQGDPSHKAEGNGLGLPLCRRILSSIGGSISAESREGECSRFMVILPDPGRA